MKSSAWAAVLMSIALVRTANATAPHRVDIHPAICEKKYGGTLGYDGNKYLSATAADVDMVCPITVPVDSSTGASVAVSFEARFQGQTQSDLTCMIMWESDWSGNINQTAGVGHIDSAGFGSGATDSNWTPFSSGGGIGVVRGLPGSLPIPMPALGDPPLQMSLQCYLKNNAYLRMISIIWQ